jgi:hypothetical protein
MKVLVLEEICEILTNLELCNKDILWTKFDHYLNYLNVKEKNSLYVIWQME